jgi:hypothetical protein
MPWREMQVRQIIEMVRRFWTTVARMLPTRSVGLSHRAFEGLSERINNMTTPHTAVMAPNMRNR